MIKTKHIEDVFSMETPHQTDLTVTGYAGFGQIRSSRGILISTITSDTEPIDAEIIGCERGTVRETLGCVARAREVTLSLFHF
jgi:hypothetical protein